MISPGEIIYEMLIDLGLATEAPGDWQMFISFLPTSPDDAVVVYDSGERVDGRLMETGERIEHPGLQIQVRGLVYEDVWGKINAIALALDAQHDVTVAISSEEAYTLHNVSRIGDIVPLGVEEIGDRRRHYFRIDAVLTYSPE